MGNRIPEYVTRTLASSLTGTIGVQTSGENLFSGIAQVGADVFNTTTAILAERKRVIDTVNADAKAREFEAQIDVSTVKAQEAFSSNPQLGIRAVNDSGTLELNEFLNTIEDSQVKGLVASRASTILRANNSTMKRWAKDQEVKNAGNNFTKVDNIEAGALRLNPSMEAFAKSIARHETRVDQANKIFSVTQSKTAMDRGRESRAKGVIFGFMEQSPVEGDRLLKSGVFNEFLSPDELHQLSKDMRNAVEGAREKQIYDDEVDVITKMMGAELLLREGNLTVDFVDGVINELLEQDRLTPEKEKALDDLRIIAAKSVDLTSIDVQDNLLKRYDQLRGLNVEADKRTATANVKQLGKFIADVNRDYKNGMMTDKKRMQLLDQVETPFNADAQDTKGKKVGFFRGAFTSRKRGEFSSPYDAGFIKTDDWLNARNFTDNTKNKAKANILSGMMESMEDAVTSGIIVTDELVEGFIDIEIRKEIARQNSKLSNIPPEGKAMRLLNGQKVIVKQDGSMTPIN